MKTVEYKLISLRETSPPNQMILGDTPEKVAEYWRTQITQSAAYNPDVENCVILFLNTRRRITGHIYISTGTLDTLNVHPREIFKGAIVANSAAIIIGHNHPSGDPTPSEADIKMTRDIIRAGQLLRIDLLDHIIMGHSTEGKGYCSLRELGYFFS
jgi:DNA repair protein RadC